ncbi:hypothetical protein R1flu_021959 [Riccia fluitans]|uniref:Uncharacterized protein n=1 Tax=Riccia fluitans TaxID=41844 RepID=A0ABD1ZSH0_9MARC
MLTPVMEDPVEGDQLSKIPEDDKEGVGGDRGSTKGLCGTDWNNFAAGDHSGSSEYRKTNEESRQEGDARGRGGPRS